jgi:ubiquinone/menaquinone biosynthesis C-methylase UbiE
MVRLGQWFARFVTDVVVRRPALWRLFRPLLRLEFDRLAPIWDTNRNPMRTAPFELALDAIDATAVRDALDVGTGTGDGALVLAGRFPGAHVVGVDVSGAMLAEAERKLPAELRERVRFEEADAAKLPYGDASFDLVAHSNMIPFFDEIARVLRPRGNVLFSFTAGPETPIYVPPERLRAELERRGFADFAEFAVGQGTAFVARNR